MKYISLIIGCFLVGIIVYGGWFGYRNLRGIGPAVLPSFRVKNILPSQALQKATNTTGLPLILPDGFSVSLFAANVKGARVLTWDPKGTLIVSSPSTGEVIALSDTNGDGVSDSMSVVVRGLNQPHGIAFFNGVLYVAESDQVASYTYDTTTYRAENKKKLVELPNGSTHFSRTIGFGPDKKLYISVGSSCNACKEKDWRRAKMLVMNPDGSNLREYASGLRNSVFFIWHPVTHEMWATDMGRDLLGDDMPPDEVNIVRDGGFYGWPYCYGNRTQDMTFDASDTVKKLCENSIAPHIPLQAHSAPLGLSFIPDNWPDEYKGDLLVSYHGSWNRTKPTGYNVVRFDVDKNGAPTGEHDFISGWLDGKNASGRPVDLLFDPKGNLYITDDKSGNIYRVSP